MGSKKQLVTAGVSYALHTYVLFVVRLESITYRYGVLPGPYQLTTLATFEVVFWKKEKKKKSLYCLLPFGGVYVSLCILKYCRRKSKGFYKEDGLCK